MKIWSSKDFHQDFVTEEDKKAYLLFLRSLLMDRPYDEIYYHIEKNVDEVRDDLALMVSGETIPMKI